MDAARYNARQWLAFGLPNIVAYAAGNAITFPPLLLGGMIDRNRSASSLETALL